MTEHELISELKSRIRTGRTVMYNGIDYRPDVLLYWFNDKSNQWVYSVELVDPTHKSSTVRVPINKIGVENI